MIQAASNGTNQQEPQPKKKQSLFAQRLAQKKQDESKHTQEITSNISSSTGFPSIFKIDDEKSQTKNQSSAYSKQKNPSSLKQVEGADEQMHEENINRIMSMTKEEIEREIEEMRQMLNPKLLNKLKGLGKNREEGKVVRFQESENDKSFKPRSIEEISNKPLDSSSIGQAVAEVANFQQSTHEFLTTIKFNSLGQVKHEKTQESNTNSDNDRNLSYILSEDFEELDQKYFSVREIENLLGSSDLYQRNYALRLAKAMVESNDIDTKDLLSFVFNVELTSIVKRLLLLVNMNLRVDGAIHLLDVLESLLNRVIHVTQEKIHFSQLLNGSQLWRNDIRIDNIGLSFFIAENESSSHELINDYGLIKNLFYEDALNRIIKKNMQIYQQIQVRLLRLFAQTSHSTEQRAKILGLRTKLLTNLTMFSESNGKMIYQNYILKVRLSHNSYQINKDIIPILIRCQSDEQLSEWLELLENASLYKKETAQSIHNDLGKIKNFQNYITEQTLKHLGSDYYCLSRAYFKFLTVLFAYQVSDLSVMDYGLVILEVIKHSQDQKLVAMMCNLMLLALDILDFKSQIILPSIKVLELRSDLDQMSNIKLIELQKACKIPFSNKAVASNQGLGYKETQLSLFNIQMIQEGSQFEFVLKQLIKIWNLYRSSNLQAQITLLSHLQPYKLCIYYLIQKKEVPDKLIKKYLPWIMRLLTINDEYFLMLLLSEFAFKDNEILKQFFLGYCISEKQTYEVSEPIYTQKRLQSFNIIINSPKLDKEIFLPLLDDWFIKPLFFINKPGDNGLQLLCQSIFKHACFISRNYDREYLKTMLGLTLEDFVVLILHLLTDTELFFDKKSKEEMFYFIQKCFYPINAFNQQCDIQAFSMNQDNTYLQEKFKHIFLKDSITSRLSTFFREQPLDSNPIILYILILLLQATQDLDFRKTLLSEISEPFVCLMRSEKDHLKMVLNADILVLYKISQKDGDEYQFYENYKEKIDRMMKDYPSEAQEEMKATWLYKIIKVNFD